MVYVSNRYPLHVLVCLKACHTRAASSRRLCGVQENAERHGARTVVSYSAGASRWPRHWTPLGLIGLHATAPTLSMLKVRAVARRCDMRRAVGTPYIGSS